jgi:hypothetical protein
MNSKEFRLRIASETRTRDVPVARREPDIPIVSGLRCLHYELRLSQKYRTFLPSSWSDPTALARKLTVAWFKVGGAKWPPAIKLLSNPTVT